jgi:hypothetical protein
MERVYFSGNGFGYMGSDLDSLKVRKEAVTVNGELLEPDGMTTLSDFFNRPLRFLGLDDSEDFKDTHIMLFYMGSNKSLFETHYVECICWIAENRIFIKNGERFGRDYNFVKGIWK